MNYTSSINTHLILPELIQLIWVSGLLGFALCFHHVKAYPNFNGSLQNGAYQNTKKSLSGAIDQQTLSLNTSVRNLYTGHIKDTEAKMDVPSAHQVASLIYPMLQTEPCVRLMILGLLCSAYIYSQTGLSHALAFDTLIWDPLSRTMTILLCISGACALILGTQAFKRLSRYEFIILLWLSMLGNLCLIKSYNFLAFYLSVELQSLSFYMLAAMRSRTEASAEAGLKYFILSAFSSAILLLGMALIYGSIGSQSFADLAITLNHFNTVPGYDTSGLMVGIGCITISLLFKLGAAPFHAWIADVYEGSNTSITAWFAITAKFGVVTVLIRNLINVSGENFWTLLAFVASISLLVGSLSAMRQIKLKRLIAFSGVANVGWFLCALVAGQWQMLILHLIIYTLLSISLFCAFITPLFRTHPDLSYRQRFTKGQVNHSADSLSVKYISDLHQISNVNPSFAFAIACALFSLAGIPPYAGFYSKYLIINALTQSEFYGILALALGSAVISAFYYVRVINTMYFARGAKKGVRKVPTPTQWWFTIHEIPANCVLLAWTSAATFLFFLKPDYVFVWLAAI